MTSNISAAHTLRLTRVIKASPDRVFQAWTQPEHLKRWSAPEGYDVQIAEVDLRVGGAYRIRMKSAEGTIHTAVGTYREVSPPSKLVYTWSWEESDDHEPVETLVTVEFRDRRGSTEVVLTHEGFGSAEESHDHASGWASCLNRLERLF